MAKKIKIILEITATHIKLLQANDEEKKSIITGFIIEKILSNRDQDIPKKLQEAIKKSNIKPSSLNLIIPRNLVTLRNVSFPSQDTMELKEMINLQAERFIPHPKEDVIIDYLITDKDPSGYSRVLLAIAHKDVVNRYLKIAEGVLPKPQIVSLSSQGICNLYSIYERNNKPEEGMSVLVDIDTTSTDICFYHKKLVFSRSIPFGIKDVNTENSENFIQQFNLTLATFKKERPEQQISKIALFYFGPIEGFAERLEKELSLPVEIIDPHKVVSLEKGLALPEGIVTEACSSSVALGFTAATKGKLIDLLPLGVHEEKKKHIKYKRLISLGIVLILALSSIMMGVFTKMHKKEQYIRILEGSLNQAAPDVKYVQEMTKKLQLVKERLNPKVLTIDILTELYKAIPEKMSLDTLEMDEGGNLFLEGIALAMSDVVVFQKSLTRSRYFSKVEIKYATKKKKKGKQVTDFKISCRMAK